MEIAQIRNIEKYMVGIPRIAPLLLNINRKGMFRTKNNPKESTTNF